MKVQLQPGLRGISGTMGDWTYRVMHGKQTIMKTPDMSNVEWSQTQQSHRQRFAEAIRYAKQAMADPPARAHYEQVAGQAGRQPFRVAVSDYFEGKNWLKS